MFYIIWSCHSNWETWTSCEKDYFVHGRADDVTSLADSLTVSKHHRYGELTGMAN
jgi:hypothetical protein